MAPIAERLNAAQQPDGGWNCERANGSVRSSVDTTINVLEGLLEFERATGGTDASRAARATGEEYLLQRSLFRRLSTGEPAAGRYLLLTHPNRWQYDVSRGLDYFRAAGAVDRRPPDPRLAEPIGLLRAKRREDGRWPLEHSPGGRVWFDVDDNVGLPSRWLTLRALRVLRWWETAASA